jgi:hypothetical protein
MNRASCHLCAALCLTGCDDPLKPAELIEEARVLGVRVSTAEGAASLPPAATARAEVLLADAEGPLTARLAYRLCVAADSQRGVPRCVGASIAEGVADRGADGVDFQLPASLAADQRLALLGVGCTQSEPALAEAPLDWACSGGEPPLGFSFDVWSQSPELQNQNPNLDELRVTVAGALVPHEDPQVPPSCEPSAVELSAGETHRLELELGESVREDGEALQLSHFSTRGDYERHYSFVSAGARPTIALSWKAPRESTPVKQYLVVRDGRGGVGWAAWSFCVR